jgi:hypothetical protein
MPPKSDANMQTTLDISSRTLKQIEAPSSIDVALLGGAHVIGVYAIGPDNRESC